MSCYYGALRQSGSPEDTGRYGSQATVPPLDRVLCQTCVDDERWWNQPWLFLVRWLQLTFCMNFKHAIGVCMDVAESDLLCFCRIDPSTSSRSSLL